MFTDQDITNLGTAVAAAIQRLHAADVAKTAARITEIEQQLVALRKGMAPTESAAFEAGKAIARKFQKRGGA